MKKFLSIIGAAALSLSLVACGAQEESAETSEEVTGTEETTTLKISASNVPHAEILEEAKDLLAERGIELDIVIAQDYVLPNIALNDGDIDANYFQHRPYLESQIADNDYDFVSAGGIHIEPIGVYSQDYSSLEELPEGAEIIMSNSVADHGRILAMLEEKGLITLKEGAGITATVDDIVENPKNLNFIANVNAELLPQAYLNNEGDAVLINSNYALDAGLNPAEDAIAIESADQDNPYANLIVVRAGDEEREEIKTLVEVLRSEEIQQFITETYDGAVIPVTE